MTKTNIIIAIITVLLVWGIVTVVKLYKGENSSNSGWITSTSSNVVIVSGKQQITITAWQGYSPRVTQAKAGIPTEIKIQGKNAYGCESAVRIPKLSYSKNLDPKWSDIVQVPEQKAWDVINGTCAMGMYNFQVKFN
jgi:plastocyanin domain-containing protein